MALKQGRGNSELTEMLLDELVLVFPTEILKTIGYFQGINFDYARYIDKIFSPNVAHFIHRERAEKDLSRKQIIPYVLLEADNKLLFYVRGKKSNEERLISNGSIGIGGHISIKDNSMFHNPDSQIYDIYNAAVVREVNEELTINTSYNDHQVAILNDDSNDVGRVHFGIVHLWSLKSQNVSKRENKITRMSFMTPAEIKFQKESLENWSSICLDNIDLIMQMKSILKDVTKSSG